MNFKYAVVFLFMLRTTLHEGLNALLLIYCVSDGKFL